MIGYLTVHEVADTTGCAGCGCFPTLLLLAGLLLFL